MIITQKNELKQNHKFGKILEMSSVVKIYEKQRLFFNSNKTKSVGFRKRKLIELKIL